MPFLDLIGENVKFKNKQMPLMVSVHYLMADLKRNFYENNDSLFSSQHHLSANQIKLSPTLFANLRTLFFWPTYRKSTGTIIIFLTRKNDRTPVLKHFRQGKL
jgi:hypothetical protein